MVTVLLDTNAFLLPHQFGIDVFSEICRVVPEKHEIATLSAIVEELTHLSDSSSEDGAAARVGLRLMGEKSVKVIESSGLADDRIVEWAEKSRGFVVTNDKALKRRLKAKGIRTISMRGKTHLELR